MTILNIKQTSDTPSVIFDINNGSFLIKGRLTSVDTMVFDKIDQWLDKNQGLMKGDITIDIFLDFLNITSSKKMLSLFHRLDDIIGVNINVNWICVDESMYEIGEDYAFMVNNIKFNIKLLNKNEIVK
jgi:hypothetical protein